MKYFGFLKRINLATLLSFATIILVCLFSSQTIDPVLVPRYIFTAVLSIALLVLILTFKNYNWNVAKAFLIDGSALPFYLFLGASCLAIVNATAISEALFTFSNYVLFFIFLLLVLTVIKGEVAIINTIVKGIILAGIVISGIGFYQLYLLSPQFPVPLDDLYNIKSTFGHKNLFAYASLLTFFFAVYGVFHLPKFWKVISMLSAIFTLASLFLLRTRGALVAFVAALFALAFIIIVSKYAPKIIGKISEKVLWILAGVLLIVFSIFYFTSNPTAESLQISKSIQDGDDRSFTIKERSQLWEGSTAMALNESFLGVGPGNWKVHFPLYGSGIWRARQGMVQFQRPHNDYLWVLTESGIFGLLGYLLIFGIVLLRGFKLQLQEMSSEKRWLIRLSMASIIAYMVVAVFSFPRERIFHQWMLVFSFAFILSLSQKQKTHTTNKWPLAIVITVLLLPILWIGLERFQGEKISANTLLHREAGNWQAILDDYKSLEKLHFYEMDPVSMPTTFYAGLAHLSLEQYEEALFYLNQAYKIHPYNIHVINNLGGIYQLRKDFSSAIFYYENALKIAPYYKEGILNLSGAYFNNNQALDAYNVLLKWHDRFEEDDVTYNYYLLFELRTILLNLSESEQNAHLFADGKEFNDDWLLACHKLAIKNSYNIERIMLDQLSRTDN